MTVDVLHVVQEIYHKAVDVSCGDTKLCLKLFFEVVIVIASTVLPEVNRSKAKHTTFFPDTKEIDCFISGMITFVTVIE